MFKENIFSHQKILRALVLYVEIFHWTRGAQVLSILKCSIVKLMHKNVSNDDKFLDEFPLGKVNDSRKIKFDIKTHITNKEC